MWLPDKEQMAAALEAMRRAHEAYGYSQPRTDDYLERMFWAGFFAANLKRPPSISNGDST